MHVETLLAFVATALLLSFAPGPDNLFVMTQAALHGRKAGLLITLGLCTGLIVHTTVVALGVAVIFQKSQLAFNLLKYAGSAYLVYLAWQAFRARSTGGDAGSSPAAEGKALYLRGILMNITNPKVSIFFLAFLPQFVNQQAGHVSRQMFTLGGIFILSALLAFSLMSIFAATVGTRFRQSARARGIMNKAAGVVFAGLAAKLATVHRG